MYYYKINNIAIQSEVELNEANGYANATPLSYEQYEAMINPEPIIIEPTLDEVKAQKLAELKTKFDIDSNSGTINTTLGFSIQARYLDMINMLALKAKLESMTENSTEMIVDIEGNIHNINVSQVQTIIDALIDKGKYLYSKLTNLENTTKTAIRIEEINLIVWE